MKCGKWYLRSQLLVLLLFHSWPGLEAQTPESPPLIEQSQKNEPQPSQQEQSTKPIFEVFRQTLLSLKDRLNEQQQQAGSQSSSSTTSGNDLTTSSDQVSSSLQTSATASQETSTSLTNASDSLTASRPDWEAYKAANEKTVSDQAIEIKDLKAEKWTSYLEGVGTGAGLVVVLWIATALLSHL